MQGQLSRAPIAVVVQQHAEESALLRHVRSVLVRAPHVRLHQLRRLDDRIAAHLDGLAVAGDYGTPLCTAALERAGAGEVFACAVRALDERDGRALDRLLALSSVLPDARRGLASAFGWIHAADLQGTVQSLLASADPGGASSASSPAACMAWTPARYCPPRCAAPMFRCRPRHCALRTSSGAAICASLRSPTTTRRWCIGRHTRHACSATASAPSRRARCHRARRKRASRHQACLLLLAADLQRGREFVRSLARAASPDASPKRRVTRACGWLGDVQHVPWLIESMSHGTLARLAGEAFSMITGADLAALDLERKPPEGLHTGPSDAPADEDDSLPWPDRERVLRWWQARAAGFTAQ